MYRLKWSDEYSVGNKGVDRDHQKLFVIYDRLLAITQSGKETLDFAQVLNELTDYSLYHFKREERYMREINFPDIEQHKKSHREYILKVAFFNKDLMGSNPPKLEDILLFLKDWWIKHILVQDLEYETHRIKNNFTATY